MLIESFLDYLQYERNYSEKTVLAYGEDIKQLQEFAQEEYGKFDPLEVEAELIREWIVSLMDKGYTSTSVNRKLSSLRTFYKYLLRQGETTIDPLRKIKGPKNKKSNIRFCSSSFIPAPVSCTLIHSSPTLNVASSRTYPFPVNFRALESKLFTICCKCPLSQLTTAFMPEYRAVQIAEYLIKVKNIG